MDTPADPRLFLLGTYTTPEFNYGDRVFCAVRGEAEIASLSEAPIPWPIGKRGRSRFLIVYGALVEAIHREASMAVAHHWGVTAQTVWAWRRDLGLVGQVNEGERLLRREAVLDPENAAARITALSGTWDDPARNAKISAAKKGKPRPAHIQEHLAEGRKLVQTPESRKKRSESHKRRGTKPPGRKKKLGGQG